MSRRNTNRYRQSVRMPVILLLVITGGLVGARWIKEVRAHNLQNRLCVQLRQLDHDCVQLKRDIGDLEGRATALLTEDSLNKQLSKLGITLDPNHATPIMEISINPADAVLPVAQLDSQSQ
jgi:hypothetical protein